MSNCKKFALVMAAVLLASLAFNGEAYAQAKKCLFVSEWADASPNDLILVDWLEQQYGAEVEITTGDEVNTGFWSKPDFAQYDFIFVSESISSSDTDSLKGAPIPVFYTECWASKWDITGWVPTNTTPQYYGNTTSSETEIKILNGDHPLAAGYATGAELTLVTGSDNNTDYLTYARPDVDHIPIAALAVDESREVVFGVEAGTVLYIAQNVKDGSLQSTSRAAAVGINANSNNYLTDDAFKLIKAGLDWILAPATGVKETDSTQPESYSLSQNYPNPFNPTTDISFALAKPGHTNLTVYNSLGQAVATLVDERLEARSYKVTFNARNLPSGLYFSQIRSGEFSQVKKMTMMK